MGALANVRHCGNFFQRCRVIGRPRCNMPHAACDAGRISRFTRRSSGRDEVSAELEKKTQHKQPRFAQWSRTHHQAGLSRRVPAHHPWLALLSPHLLPPSPSQPRRSVPCRWCRWSCRCLRRRGHDHVGGVLQQLWVGGERHACEVVGTGRHPQLCKFEELLRRVQGVQQPSPPRGTEPGDRGRVGTQVRLERVGALGRGSASQWVGRWRGLSREQAGAELVCCGGSCGSENEAQCLPACLRSWRSAEGTRRTAARLPALGAMTTTPRHTHWSATWLAVQTCIAQSNAPAAQSCPSRT